MEPRQLWAPTTPALASCHAVIFRGWFGARGALEALLSPDGCCQLQGSCEISEGQRARFAGLNCQVHDGTFQTASPQHVKRSESELLYIYIYVFVSLLVIVRGSHGFSQLCVARTY